jgi:2-polyprenyl-6-methoxyphenol hydroxylase-like FAD-dependent oxidoreductase
MNQAFESGARRAIVIGASLAGLLAARVLAESFDEVLLIDRDGLPAGNAHRKATPHSQHAHGLLARGCQALETLFPGITDEWLAAGGQAGDLQHNVPFFAGRLRFASGDAGVQAMAVGRVVIEGTVRRRVLALPQLRTLTGVDVKGLSLSADRARVSGVRVQALDRDGDDEATLLPAALVIDASGRGSRLPQWLQSLGFEAPHEDRVKVEIRYATAYFERLPGELPGVEVALCAARPDCPLPAVMIGQEGARWVITLGGYGADVPPLDRAGFVQRAQQMASPEIAAVASAGRFVSEPMRYRFPHSQRRHYERLARLPQGLLAIGDAICSFNPIYGQGMSVAACEALALRDALASGVRDPARRYFAAAARIVDVPWATAVGADLAIPSVEGERSMPVRLIGAYMTRLFQAAQHDPAVALAFLKVAHLLARPPSLLRPGMVWRVLRAGRKPMGSASTAPPQGQPVVG